MVTDVTAGVFLFNSKYMFLPPYDHGKTRVVCCEDGERCAKFVQCIYVEIVKSQKLLSMLRLFAMFGRESYKWIFASYSLAWFQSGIRKNQIARVTLKFENPLMSGNSENENLCKLNKWVFPKRMVPPKSAIENRVFHYKSSILR